MAATRRKEKGRCFTTKELTAGFRRCFAASVASSSHPRHPCNLRFSFSCGEVGGIEEEPLQRGLRPALLDETSAGFVQERRNLREHLRRGVFQDQLGLVFDCE